MKTNSVEEKGKLIYIEWQDAIHNAEWFPTHLAEKWHSSTGYIIKECGWLVKEDKRGITLAVRCKPSDDYTESQLGGLQYIPKPWIIKRKVIKI